MNWASEFKGFKELGPGNRPGRTSKEGSRSRSHQPFVSFVESAEPGLSSLPGMSKKSDYISRSGPVRIWLRTAQGIHRPPLG
jgi:hypothetical protein